jgi:hypothetical protein
MGFEPTIAVFERVKTFHALDRGPTVIGLQSAAGEEMHEFVSLCCLDGFGVLVLETSPDRNSTWLTDIREDTLLPSVCILMRVLSDFE